MTKIEELFAELKNATREADGLDKECKDADRVAERTRFAYTRAVERVKKAQQAILDHAREREIAEADRCV